MSEPYSKPCSETYSDGRTAILELLGSRRVAYYPALAAIGGGVTAGVFLAQLFYWHINFPPGLPRGRNWQVFCGRASGALLLIPEVGQRSRSGGSGCQAKG